MKFLTRQEEMVLLAAWKLGADAYGVTIAKELHSSLSDPSSKRGGRRKRLYKMTRAGIKALIETKKVQESMWQKISISYLENDL
jgi:PadR family transcriptional regulator PadR